jgi:serine-type D-Ala-D-Ala carboxypeptidase (penicillin-binding protein 5/6)
VPVSRVAATIQHSANDACHAVAAHVAGDEAAFVRLMNVRAAAMGLRATRFTNACGHDHPGHRSTARELAVLGVAAMANPRYAAHAAESGGTIRALESGREFRIGNKNELIGRYRGAIGIKSGSTPRAGKCIAALAERDGVRVLLVLLDARERWWTAVDMLNHAFERAD